MRFRIFMSTWLVVLGTVGLASAQSGATTGWQRGSTLSLHAGAAAADNLGTALGGGSIGWQMTPRFGLEGSGDWIGIGGSDDAFAASFTAHVSAAGGRGVRAIVLGGVGLYHASFGPASAEIPGFYGRRLGETHGLRGSSFTDPSVVLGFGVNAFLSRHWAIQPDVREILVMRNARTYPVTTVGLRIAYHFEDHPITP
jgi:hypothetical protein